MATLRAAVISLLEGDVTLVATLTGGIYDRRELSRTATPDAYDARGKLEPCAVVTLGAEAQLEPGPTRPFEQGFFRVWLYEAEGNHYAAIDVAKDRIKALLHGQTVSVSPGGVHGIRYADSIGDSYDEVLKVEMTYLRFWAWRYRG